MKDLQTYRLNNGINVHYIKSEKFKNANFTVNITVPLKRPDVTFNALLPAVLRRGCNKFPETKELNIYLDELYGSNISYGIKKRGNYQVIVINFNTIADKYAPDLKPFEKILDLSREMLLNPLVTNGAFSDNYVNREKENLKQYIESIINDKREYAKLKLIQEMYNSETFGIFSNGYVEDLEKVTSKTLFDYYKKLIHDAHWEIFITGPVDINYCISFLEEHYKFEKNTFLYSNTDFGKYRKEINYISESSDVTQGKLSIGLRTEITNYSPLYYAMVIMNNLYGGSVHSKLFLNVREKLSLAYYAGSSYDAYKGLILVNSGIEFDNYEIALKEIFKQLDDVKNGLFTDKDIEYSKLSVINAYNSIKDSAISMENFYSSQSFIKKPLTIDEFVERINDVQKDDIIKAALTVSPDTVFFLKGRED